VLIAAIILSMLVHAAGGSSAYGQRRSYLRILGTGPLATIQPLPLRIVCPNCGVAAQSRATLDGSTFNLDDGSVKAPKGKPQLPQLLSGYAIRPPWRVAGVDYAVGPQQGVTLKDPTTISIPGVSLDYSHHWILITQNDTTLDGYDFTLSGGWTIVIQAANVTIRNFKISIADGHPQDPIETFAPANNITLEYGLVDGARAAGASTFGALIFHTSKAGTMTVQYLLLQNAVQHSIETLGPSNIYYNLFDSAMYAKGMHGDFIQSYSSNTIIKFNTFYQPLADATGFPGGVVAALNTSLPGNNQIISNVVFNNNTLVGIGATGHASGPQALENWINWTPTGTGNVVQSPVAKDNFCTMSGNRFSDFAYRQVSNFGNNGVVSPTLLNNRNMETGLPIRNVTSRNVTSRGRQTTK